MAMTSCPCMMGPPAARCCQLKQAGFSHEGAVDFMERLHFRAMSASNKKCRLLTAVEHASAESFLKAISSAAVRAKKCLPESILSRVGGCLRERRETSVFACLLASGSVGLVCLQAPGASFQLRPSPLCSMCFVLMLCGTVLMPCWVA